MHDRQQRRRRQFHPYWTFPRPQQSWFEIYINQRNFVPERFFRRHMRIGWDIFNQLLLVMRPYVQRQNTHLRQCIPADKVLAIGLYRLAHGGSYDNTALVMNVGKGTVYEAFHDVIDGLCELRHEYIKFPETLEDTLAAIETFAPLTNLPNAVGAIDGSHIPIKAPEDSPADYYSCYQQYDVIIQGVVNGKMLFMDVAAGFPGSLHDTRVCRNSSLYERAENGDILTEPLHQIGNVQIKPYLLGDSAYPISPWLQKPYPEGTRDPLERNFNKELSSARVKVECVFGILKGRWRILDLLEEGNISVISKIIVACCVLHNFCILAGDEWDGEDGGEDEDRDNNKYIVGDGEDIRELLKNNL